MFEPGQKVRVARDLEVESADRKGSGWIGAVGTFVNYREGFAIVQFNEDQIPEGCEDSGDKAWFSDDELEVLT